MHKNVSATRGYSSDGASSSGVEASLRSRGVMREVRPSKESREGMKEAASLGGGRTACSLVREWCLFLVMPLSNYHVGSMVQK